METEFGNHWPSWCTVFDDQPRGMRLITAKHGSRSLSCEVELSPIKLDDITWLRAQQLKYQLIADQNALKAIVKRLKS